MVLKRFDFRFPEKSIFLNELNYFNIIKSKFIFLGTFKCPDSQDDNMGPVEKRLWYQYSGVFKKSADVDGLW